MPAKDGSPVANDNCVVVSSGQVRVKLCIHGWPESSRARNTHQQRNDHRLAESGFELRPGKGRRNCEKSVPSRSPRRFHWRAAFCLHFSVQDPLSLPVRLYCLLCRPGIADSLTLIVASLSSYLEPSACSFPVHLCPRRLSSLLLHSLISHVVPVQPLPQLSVLLNAKFRLS